MIFGIVIYGVVDVLVLMWFFCYLLLVMFVMFVIVLVELSYVNIESVLGMLMLCFGLIGVGVLLGWVVCEVYVGKD